MSRLEVLDIKIILIVLLIIVSTGHVGRLFADREAMGQGGLGYIFALALDVALAISLYEVGCASARAHKFVALAGFILACGISGGFNVYYYREFYPDDPLPLSILLGLAAPTLAAFFGLLKSKGDIKRQETKTGLEMEKFRIQQEEETKRAVAIAKEKTAQSKELTKRRELIAAERERKQAEKAAKEKESQRQRLANLKKELPVYRILLENPATSQEEIARRIEKSQRTVSAYMKTLEDVGAIRRDDDGIKVLWHQVDEGGQ